MDEGRTHAAVHIFSVDKKKIAIRVINARVDDSVHFLSCMQIIA